MKHNYALAVLTLINFGILIVTLIHDAAPVEASGPSPVVRARGLEIVDAQGRLRASLSVIPAGPAPAPDVRQVDPDGKVYPEAVVFRLIRPDGRPSVKIATTEESSGIDLSGGIDPTYIVLSSEQGLSSMTLTNQNGHRQIIKP